MSEPQNYNNRPDFNSDPTISSQGSGAANQPIGSNAFAPQNSAPYSQGQYGYQSQYSQPGPTSGQPPFTTNYAQPGVAYNQPGYAQPSYSAPPTDNNSKLMDFLAFRYMVTPVIIQVIFWLGIVVIVFGALAQLSSPFGNPLGGLLLLVVGPLFWRVICELYILLFRIHSSLNEVKNELRQRP